MFPLYALAFCDYQIEHGRKRFKVEFPNGPGRFYGPGVFLHTDEEPELTECLFSWPLLVDMFCPEFEGPGLEVSEDVIRFQGRERLRRLVESAFRSGRELSSYREGTHRFLRIK